MFGNRLARPGEARCAIRDVAPEFAELFGQAGVADPVGNGRVLDRVPEANKPLAIRTRRDHDTTPSPNRRRGHDTGGRGWATCNPGWWQSEGQSRPLGRSGPAAGCDRLAILR